MGIFKWRKMIFVANDVPELVEMNDSFIAAGKQFGIEIVHSFFIPLGIDFTTFYEDYAEMIDTIIDSDVRIIMSAVYDLDLPFKLYESFYRKGFRAPDFIPIFGGVLDSNDFRVKYPKYFRGTIEFFNGSLSLTQELWVGSSGEKVI